jgi:hypothetical protein
VELDNLLHLALVAADQPDPLVDSDAQRDAAPVTSPNILSASTSAKPMMALGGVRSSWDMFARNSDLWRLANSSWRLLSSISRNSRVLDGQGGLRGEGAE